MFLDHWSLICSRHKEETLTFLTVKTAAVRCGAKPAELLRVPLCGRAGMAGCDAVRNVFARLGLPYRILSEDAGGALALFYHPTRLNEALSDSRASAFLTRRGCPPPAGWGRCSTSWPAVGGAAPRTRWASSSAIRPKMSAVSATPRPRSRSRVTVGVSSVRRATAADSCAVTAAWNSGPPGFA